MSDLTWTDDTRRLGDLVPQEDNPKQIRKEKAIRLVKSWKKWGQPDVIAIGPDNRIYNGHQRYFVWSAAYGPDFEVAVRVSSRPLARAEWQELTVTLHEGAVGEWDWDKLAEWDGVGVDELVEWGFDEQLISLGWDDTYTRKIETPEYIPQGPMPELSMLYDDSKTVVLIDGIDACDGISDEEKRFLRVASQRHTVFDFQSIANYYAYANPDMQRLMEDNALVIIDFDKAICQGFIELSMKIADMVKDEYGDE